MSDADPRRLIDGWFSSRRATESESNYSNLAAGGLQPATLEDLAEAIRKAGENPVFHGPPPRAFVPPWLYEVAVEFERPDLTYRETCNLLERARYLARRHRHYRDKPRRSGAP